MVNFSFRIALLSGLVALLAVSPASATLIESTDLNDNQFFFSENLSTTDLINIGSASLGSFSSTDSASFNVEGAHDGSNVSTSGFAYWGNAGPDVEVTLTYELTGSATGYDITSINSMYGWRDSRLRHAAQRFDVMISTLATPAYSLLHTVLYDPYSDTAQGSTQVTLTDDTGVLASGVTGIQFLLRSDNNSEIGVIHEIDVFGSATAIPEPTSVALLGLGGLLIALARRWR
jgi:hypothetical protein